MATTQRAPAQRPVADWDNVPADMFELVARALNVAYWEWLPATNEIHMSAALLELFGYDAGTWTWQRHLELMHPDDRPGYRAMMTAYFKSGADRAQNSFRFKLPSGRYVWVHNHHLVQRDERGRVTRMVGAVADITEAKEREAENSALIARQAASIEILKTISASPDNPQPVFELIARHARELCGAAYAAVTEYDGELLQLRAIDGFDLAGAELLRGTYPRPATPETIQGRMALTGQIVHIRDLSAYYRDMGEVSGVVQSLRDMSRDQGAKSMLAVPLLREGRVIGGVLLRRKEIGGFDDSQIALVQSFAEQAVIAISSAIALRELRARTAELTEALEYQSATADVLKAISRSAFDLDTVLDTLTRSAAKLCGAETASVRLREGDGFRLGASYGISPQFTAFTRTLPLKPGRWSLPARIMLSNAIEHIPDNEADTELDPDLKRQTPNRSALGVPLLRDGRLEGLFVLGRRRAEPFTQRQIDLVQTFADQALIAIENARLFNEVQARTRELARSLDDLRRAQDRLVQTEKMASLGQVTAGIAHEIKNPLNFVNNFADLSRDLLDELLAALAADAPDIAPRLQAEIDDLTATLKSNLRKITEHGRRADGIVKNMLLHSREGGGERRSADLNAVAEEALNLAYHGARAEKPGFNVTLVRQLDPAVGSLELYPQEFTRVLLNLIGNGFYAVDRRRRESQDPAYTPTVTVATEARPDAAVVRIRDNGTGIPDAVKAHLFEPFFTTKPAGEGTGLGLSISHDIIVKQHGGSITVDSRLGEFTEFTLILPRGAGVPS